MPDCCSCGRNWLRSVRSCRGNDCGWAEICIAGRRNSSAGKRTAGRIQAHPTDAACTPDFGACSQVSPTEPASCIRKIQSCSRPSYARVYGQDLRRPQLPFQWHSIHWRSMAITCLRISITLCFLYQAYAHRHTIFIHSQTSMLLAVEPLSSTWAVVLTLLALRNTLPDINN